jgi:hypothetical protein
MVSQDAQRGSIHDHIIYNWIVFRYLTRTEEILPLIIDQSKVSFCLSALPVPCTLNDAGLQSLAMTKRE